MKDLKKSISDLKSQEADTNNVQGGKKIMIDPRNEVNELQGTEKGPEGSLINEGNEKWRRYNDKFGNPE